MDQQPATNEPEYLDELEEGEIADDSNDGCSITNDDNDNDCANAFGDDASAGAGGCGAANAAANRGGQAPADGSFDGPGGGGGGGGGGQKRRKKVVRKVKRKIKVKKKVIRKKGGGAGGGGGENVGAVAAAAVVVAGGPDQQPQQPQNNPQQLDSLWEQQILMLQELQRQQQQADQKHTQILRAAATDEDLRIFPQMLARPATNNHQVQPLQALQPPIVASIASTTTTLNATCTIPASVSQPHTNLTYTTTSLAPLPPVNSNHPAYHLNNPGAPNAQFSTHHQTPSSPDDENGKSSYEAISKMLTLLRNSANVSDPSEIADNDLLANNNDTSSMMTDANAEQKPNTKRGDIEYSLVPILVAGIDYTKYKLLSQYEPKFKNDPRLNQLA